MNRNISTRFCGQEQNVSEERGTYLLFTNTAALFVHLRGHLFGGKPTKPQQEFLVKDKELANKRHLIALELLEILIFTNASLPLCGDNVRAMASIHPCPFSVFLNLRYVRCAVLGMH